MAHVDCEQPLRNVAASAAGAFAEAVQPLISPLSDRPSQVMEIAVRVAALVLLEPQNRSTPHGSSLKPGVKSARKTWCEIVGSSLAKRWGSADRECRRQSKNQSGVGLARFRAFAKATKNRFGPAPRLKRSPPFPHYPSEWKSDTTAAVARYSC